jgi:hypothetical protein
MSEHESQLVQPRKSEAVEIAFSISAFYNLPMDMERTP